VDYEHQEMGDSFGNDFSLLDIYYRRSLLVKTVFPSKKGTGDTILGEQCGQDLHGRNKIQLLGRENT
jgi:hypothetical protein